MFHGLALFISNCGAGNESSKNQAEVQSTHQWHTSAKQLFISVAKAKRRGALLTHARRIGNYNN